MVGEPGAIEQLTCGRCGLSYERPDMADCTFIADEICSLCCSLESACHDECKKTRTGRDRNADGGGHRLTAPAVTPPAKLIIGCVHA